MFTIAVIDDGISNQVVKDLAFDLEVSEDLTINKCNNSTIECSSHGTRCACIIKKHAENITLGSIKILDTKTKRGFAEAVCVVGSTSTPYFSLISIPVNFRPSFTQATPVVPLPMKGSRIVFAFTFLIIFNIKGKGLTVG